MSFDKLEKEQITKSVGKRIQECRQKAGLTQEQLSEKSGISQKHISRIEQGYHDTHFTMIYKIAKALEVTVEELLEPSIEIRIDFDLFKSNVCHQLKEMGDLEFITYTLTNNKIKEYEKKKWYPECLYLLAMIDYLSRINDIPLYNDYDELRKSKLKKIVYPASVIMLDKALKNKNVKKEAFEESIPEFKRFNIVESDIRNVI